MTPQQLKTMKLALDLATMHHTDDGYAALRAKVRSASKEALAQPEQEEKLPPVEIGVDVTDIGTTVVAFYRRPNAVMEMFYSQFHPLAQPEQEPVIDKSAAKRIATSLGWTSQRTWVGLTDEDMYVVSEEESCSFIAGAKWSEEILKEKNAICSPFMISELWRLNK